ncbi:MAG TPA: hypothetical protein VNA22_00120 [Pyrinomonadaceae bacterium]|nr:hypothetical protein [Pyrinomonadaceae bacterium]
MNSILAVGVLIAALAFCGLGDRIKNISGAGGGNASNTGGASTTASGSGSTEKPQLTPAQQNIQESSSEVKWDDQGISWKLPAGWPKMEVRKESLNYGAPGQGFLIASISTMPSSFPSEISLEATYTSALEQMKQGKYETARWLEIDGVRGVEWVEAMPEDKDGPRRHQWIAFRNYQGQNQQLNIMVSTKGSAFDKQRDTFAAIMYSMKIPKG